MDGSFQRLGFFSPVLRVWDLTIGPDGAFGMDIHWLVAWKPNIVMEQNLMEGSFYRPDFFSHVMIVWDLTVGPNGAFGMNIHWLEAWKQNIVMGQNHKECSFQSPGFLSIKCPLHKILLYDYIWFPRFQPIQVLKPQRKSLASKLTPP